MGFKLKYFAATSRKLPLRLFLVIPFLVQIFVAVGLVGYFSFINGKKAVNDLANQLETEISLRVDLHLDQYLATPHQINQINADAVVLRKLDLRDFEGTGHYFWKQMQVFDVGYVYYVLPTGEYAGAGIFLDPTKVIIDELSANTQGRTNTYATDSLGNRTKLLSSYDNYHPQKEAAYTDAVKASKPVWSKVYQWDNFPEIISISASYPLYDKTNKLLGVLITNLRLSQISDFLRKLKISSSGKAFILEGDGSIIASSSTEQPYTLLNGKAQRLNVLNSKNRLIQATAKYLKQHFGDFRKIESSQTLDFMLSGKRQFVQVVPWLDKFGLNWLVVVVIPESDFMKQIDANTRTTILLCLGTLGLTTLLGMFTSHWIAEPIKKLRVASVAIARGEINQTVDVKGIDELEDLGQSFNKMAAQLKSSFDGLEIRVAERTTELKEKNERLRQALEELTRVQGQLIQSEKMSSLGQMVAGVAHEINNPISFIHGNLIHADRYIQDLLDLIIIYQQEYPQPTSLIEEKALLIDLDFLVEDLPKLINSMNVGTRRIRNIVLGLRNFSRLDEAEMKPVNVHEGIESSLMILQHRLQANDDRPAIEVFKKYGQLPEINCYASALNQVFMNILSNAIDALEESNTGRSCQEIQAEPNRITINTTICADRNVAFIRIADNGVGMSEEVRSKIFDYMFTTKPVGKGTGLGLAIARQIVVEKHGGTIEVNSTLGQGAEFVLSIPV